MVTGALLVTVPEDALIPVPATIVHVPPVTERVVVGLEPELPARVSVTVVDVPVEKPPITEALVGEGVDERTE
jgi:hypothetical protein